MRSGRRLPPTNMIPSTVRVGGLQVKVRRDTSPEGINAFGYFQQTQDGAEICVDERLYGVRELATFLHELTHAIDETYGLGLQHKQVHGLGEGLAQALEPCFAIPSLRKPRTSRKTSAAPRQKQTAAQKRFRRQASKG